jgi:HEAT repeat protein
MKRILLIAVGGGLLIALSAGFLVFTSRTNDPDAGSLAKTAREGASLDERRTAAAELGNFPGEEAVAELERLVKESRDPEVIAGVIPMLTVRKPKRETTELLFEKLNHPDLSVREAAFDSLRLLVRFSPKDKVAFAPDDPENKREAAAKLLKEKYKDAPLR